MTDRKLAYSVPEAAEVLGCGTSRIREAVAAGELPVVPKAIAGTRILIPVDALEAHIAGTAEFRAKAS